MTPPEMGEPEESRDIEPMARPAGGRADRQQRSDARRAARQARAAERSAERSAARSKGSGRRSASDDPFVEAPRAPKAGGAQRRRGARLIAAGILGAAGLLCSVVLALGALLLALGTTDSSDVFETVSSICDALVGPLRDIFSFSGPEAGKKEALAAWGTGSIGYLVVSLVVQRYVPPRSDD